MKIKILSLSDSDKHFSSTIQEYLKRLGKTIEMMNIKPTKNGTKEQIIQSDTAKVIKYLDKDQNYKILLDIE